MSIKHSVVAFAAGGLIFGGSFAAAPHEESMKGSTVTLTSCVEQGQKADTFVLTHVADVPAHPPMKGGRVVYWLDKSTAKKLRPHVGHQIRLIAKVADVDKSEMEVKDNDEGMIVEIEGPGRDVRTSPEKAGVSPAGRTDEKHDIKTTLVKLKVDKLEMVSERCMLTR